MLDLRQLQELRAYANDRDDVVALYLFGSETQGRAKRGSDVDLAVMLTRPLHGFERVRMETDLSRCIGRDVHLVIFSDADPVLKHQILKPKALVYEGDRAERVRQETAGRYEYLDTRFLHQEIRRYDRGGP